MLYSGIVFFGFAMMALALGLVGWAPGAAGVVNVALLMSMVSFLAAGIGISRSAVAVRRVASRRLASMAHGASGFRS
jgi:uncharacterized membrane protein YtjA (UPF0391 family)